MITPAGGNSAVGLDGATIRLRLRGQGAQDAWRRAADESAQGFIFEEIGSAGNFSGDYFERQIAEIRVADVRGAPLSLRDAKPSDTPVVVLHAVVEGHPTYRSHTGELTPLRPGQVMIRRRLAGSVIRSERTCRIVTAVVPQHLLAPRFANPAMLNRYTVVVDNALPPRLLHAFIVALTEVKETTAPIAPLDALGGLLSMVLAQMPQPPEPVAELTARRASEAAGYLRRHFANPALTPTMMAEDMGISVRYAHKLMRLTGRSFRQALIAQRLEAARAAFAANMRPRQTIADIAISVGFNDLSQFNRHFRAAFGMTPRAARRLDEARGQPPHAA